MTRYLPLFLGAVLPLGGCNNMVQQPRDDTYEESALFPNGMAMQHPPEGTISLERPEASASDRPPLTAALIARGGERYEIFCQPCHAGDGSGHGTVPARGFPRPPDLRSARLRRAGSAHVFDVVTHGYGVMYSYADRVRPGDRWAIAAYIRTLQNTSPPVREAAP